MALSTDDDMVVMASEMGVLPIPDERIVQTLDTRARALGFTPRSQTLEVHGTCAQCAAASKPTD